jgi:DNA-binding CsgD family transcriptional regulator
MLKRKKLNISGELFLQRYGNGVKLVPPAHAVVLGKKSIQVSKIFQLPFNVYFLSSESILQAGNEQHACTLGYDSPNSAVGKSVFTISQFECAKMMVENDKEVVRSNRIMITEEDHIKVDNQDIRFHCITIKSPWYDNSDKLVGVFGCSIVMGTHPFAESLRQIADLGLLSAEQRLMNIANISDVLIRDNIYLSRREMQCLRLIVRGQSAAEIARQLDLSSRTVEHHTENIKMKMNVDSKSELIAKVIDQLC